MNPGQVLELETLLAPLTEGGACGANLRDVANNPTGRTLYDAVRGARNQARLKEKPQMLGDPTAPQGPPDEWAVVKEKAIEALATKSKDLEIATYLIEAIVRLNGFGGLREGLSLYRGLVEQFWDSLYPPLEEDGPAGRVAGLAGLNGDSTRDGALLFPISRVQLTDGDGFCFGLFHHQCAVAMEKLPPERQDERVKAGQVSLAMFNSSARKTPVSFYRPLVDDLKLCIEEYDKLTAALETKCGLDAPSSSKIREALVNCQQIVESVAGPLLKSAAGQQGEQTMGNLASSPDSAASFIVPRSFRNRDEAFETIMRVAQFFRETEPQSPVVPALEQVVRWGKLPLPELMTELIPDEGTRIRFFQLVGIRPTGNNNQ